MALPVYDNAEREEFWKGEKKQGGHAICCVGYNEDGLILENTWGSGYGKNGKIIKIYKFRSMVVGADEKLKEYLERNK